MRASWPSGRAGRSGRAVRVAIIALCLQAVFFAMLNSVVAQTGGDRWVTLATRALDTGTGRVSFDLRKAKGAFKAIRLSVKSGALTLTAIEVRYGDRATHKEPRALVLRQGERTQPIDSRGIDRFIDTLQLNYKAAEASTEAIVIAIEGLQSQAGAVMVRVEPPAVADAPPAGAAPGQPPAATPVTLRANTEAHRRAEEEEQARLEATRKAAEEVRRKEAASAAATAPRSFADGAPAASPAPPAAAPAPVVHPPAPAGGAAAGASDANAGEPWDVVPVYYGTDRAAEPLARRASYGSDRAKRLEVGRALVTVPKRHEVPNVERPWVYRLPFTSIVLTREREDPKLHFTLKDVRALSREDFIAAINERLGSSKSYKNHALVFVHGFNTSFDNALFRMAQITYDLKFDGASFVYSWPSKGSIGLSDYNYDRESTGQAEPHLRAFLDLVARETGASSISIIAHSMGNQLLLPVLRDLRRSAPQSIAISQVILAAPDVDRDTFEYLAKEIAGVSRGVTMLAASSDRALDVSRRFWGGVPRAGDVPTGGPIVVAGIDTIDVTALSSDVFSLNHSGYAEKAVILSDIQNLILTGLRPPEQRFPILQRVSTARGDYWRYPER